MEQDRKVADLLWDLVRNDGERRHDAKMDVGHERCGDQHAVEHVVEAIPDQDERRRRGIAMRVGGVHVRHVPFADLLVAMPPEHHLFEHEEHEQAREESQPDVVRTGETDLLDCVRQQSEQRGAEQCAGRKADQMRQHAGAQRLRRDEEQRRRERAESAAEQGEQYDPGEQRHSYFIQTSVAMRPVVPSRR